MTPTTEIAVVTGGASGIGEATVAILRAQHIPVVAVDLAWPEADPGRAVTRITGDAAAASTWTAVREACAELGGAPTKLVINAARLIVGTILDVSEADLRGVLEVNVLGAYHALRACLPTMIERGGGAIVTVASVDALVAEQNLAAYNTSKGALLQLTRSVAIDHALDGVRANCVCPGAVDTPFFRRHVDAAPDPAAFLREKAGRHPRGRILEPTEVANAIHFLLTDAASGINGAALTVDAGLLASFDFRPPPRNLS
ncbi:SDR family oxidoreductase [Phenylobacterium sp. LjRoot219]|uniref:SDR family NAD(P)-dependent oxidoreductase n=1 Tax=Phenylobacterium sp. LjRoot219 TaxID=3342283 RepID=UPI003ECDBC7B